MKLLVMGNNGHLGGLSVHYTTLVDYLEKEDLELFCIHVNDQEKKIFNNDKVQEFVVPFQPDSLFKKLKKVLILLKAVRVARKFKPDLFVATGLGYGYSMIASKLPSTVFKIFEEVHFEAKPDKLRLRMLNDFDAVATQTKGMISAFQTNVSSAKPVNFLPCFSKEYTAEDYQAIPSIEKEIRIAYFGRLARNKGLKEFINFTDSIFKQNVELKLDIYGGGAEKDAIQAAIVNNNLDKQISLKGFYDDKEFPELIGNYHGIILPSIDTEGLPLILIEAMRFGRPVFTTTTGAMPEIGRINEQGMLVSEKDRSSMEYNLGLFVKKLRDSGYDASYIYNIYKQNFSNEAFKRNWINMLQNPKRYFLNN